MAFRIIRNDITKVTTDAIVNTANPEVAIGGGVDSAIYEAAGVEKLLQARKEIGRLEVGEVAITPAFDLDAKYIIHSSGPYWIDGSHHEAELLRQCYDKSLEIAHEQGCESIAFPLMATGTYGFPKELGLQIALEAFNAFLLQHEMEIVLVVFGETAYKLSGQIFEDVRAYVDNIYVAKRLQQEYHRESVVLRDEARPHEAPSAPIRVEANRSCSSVFLSSRPDFISREESDFLSDEEIDTYEEVDFDVDENDESDEKLYEAKALKEVVKVEETGSATFPIPAFSIPPQHDFQMHQDIGTFGDYLQQMINKKGMKNSEVYIAANLTKQYFSKLINNKVAPSKIKILSLAIALHLNMDETVDFLRMSGYALSPFSEVDRIFEYFIRNKIYDIYRIDIMLFDCGLPTLVND